jgi:nucleoside-diphosphate-sugar epimerase
LLAAHAAGSVRATIGRGSDFFGPGAASTVAGQLVFPAVMAGKRAHWIGSLDAPHTLSFTGDFARGLVTLGTDSRALGEIWHIPAAPPVTGREFIELAFEVAGQSPNIGLHGRRMMQLAGLFNRQMREVLEVLDQFESPFVLNAEKFTRTFGDLGVTNLREAIARTLEWERKRGAS